MCKMGKVCEFELSAIMIAFEFSKAWTKLDAHQLQYLFIWL